jgi:hypothetical protein
MIERGLTDESSGSAISSVVVDTADSSITRLETARRS